MKKNEKTALGIVGATMAAAAGAYYLYGSEKAASHRRTASAWMKRAEKEIIAEAKRLKNKAYTDEHIQRVIREVAKRYTIAKNIDPEDVAAFVAMAQKGWKDAGKAVKSRVPSRATLKKTVKKAVRTVTKKSAKKAK